MNVLGILFGTDGVRGVANKDLTGELAYKLGQAGAYVLTSELNSRPKVLVGMDTRISGDMLNQPLWQVFVLWGAKNAVYLGVVPTPAVAYLVRHYKADAGVVISASHNSFEFNGIKFFNNKGFKLSDEIEERIESIILNNSEEISLPIGDKLGTETTVENAVDDYMLVT